LLEDHSYWSEGGLEFIMTIEMQNELESMDHVTMDDLSGFVHVQVLDN
jgi:hypothetical protein